MTESGVSVRTRRVLLVGVEDSVADAVAAAAPAGDFGVVRVAQGIAARREIEERRPELIVVAPGLWRDERRAIAEAAAENGGRVLELPATASPSCVASLVTRRSARARRA